MNEEIDESEFYHQDFTTASEWEIFIARIEEVIHQWSVQDKKSDDRTLLKLTEDAWVIREEKIQFAEIEFVLSHHWNIKETSSTASSDEAVDDNKKQSNPIENNNDFKLFDRSILNSKCLVGEWYGLNKFITLSPFGNAGIISESQIKILLSSVQIAISNTNCNIPIFVQIREKWQQCFLGVYEGYGTRTNFEMIHIKRGPQHCQYLTGLLDLFKTKIMSPVTLDPINISVQLTFHLSDFGNSTWKQELPDVDNETCEIDVFYSLPFGVTFDPINTIILKATWSNLPDHLIVDSENYSDFDPLQAPQWSLLVKMAEQPVCLLSESLFEVLQLTSNVGTMYDILGNFASSGNSSSTENPLDLLTESKIPAISTVIKRAARNSLSKVSRGVAPLSESVLVLLLYYIFPDADQDLAYPYEICKDKELEDNNQPDVRNLLTQCGGFKTCPEQSLPWRLAVIMAHSLVSMGGVRSFAYLWFEFVQEMRYRWEKSILVPGINEQPCIVV